MAVQEEGKKPATGCASCCSCFGCGCGCLSALGAILVLLAALAVFFGLDRLKSYVEPARPPAPVITPADRASLAIKLAQALAAGAGGAGPDSAGAAASGSESLPAAVGSVPMDVAAAAASAATTARAASAPAAAGAAAATPAALPAERLPGDAGASAAVDLAPIELDLTEAELNSMLVRLRAPLYQGFALDSVQASLGTGRLDIFLLGSGFGQHQVTLRLGVAAAIDPQQRRLELIDVSFNRARVSLERTGTWVKPWLVGFHLAVLGLPPTIWDERLDELQVASGSLRLRGRLRDLVVRYGGGR